MNNKVYIAIDLKSFYASVECVERGLDPLNTNLVVADVSRTEKTICLAVTPSMKAYGISGRARLFEVIAAVKAINAQRRRAADRIVGSSYIDSELKANPRLEFDYVAAVPRMALYMDYSTRIYEIYLKYVAPEDIHVYSVDEVFIDLTPYLKTYKTTARELTMRIILDVLSVTGITATAGIGTNLYLAKVAMDIVAKRIPADKNGVRIAELNEMSYRELLWNHRPLTDFWRVGHGYSSKLESRGIYTMGDIARISISNEELLYKLFGINAELLIDHSWGWEPCSIEDIKAYKPMSNSISTGQVLSCPYEYDKARLIAMEMCDLLVLDLVEKRLVTDQIVLTVGYDAENLKYPSGTYKGTVTLDHYGRAVPKHAHGTANLSGYTSSTNEIMGALAELFDRVVDRTLLVRRVNITANHIVNEAKRNEPTSPIQLDIFTDFSERERLRVRERLEYEREKQRQLAVISIKRRFGKNAILRGMNFSDGATAIERNNQIGGHKA